MRSSLVSSKLRACGTSSTPAVAPKRPRAVSFERKVRVHSHALTLGDHPGVSNGVPLTLKWEADGSETWDLDTESACKRKGVPRLSPYVRETIAAQEHPRDSLVNAREEVRSIQRSRLLSEMDSTESWWQRILFLGGRKKQQNVPNKKSLQRREKWVTTLRQRNK